MKRILLFILLAAGLWTAENWWLSSQQADLSARLALNQINGGDSAARELRAFQSLKDSVHLFTGLVTFLGGVLLLSSFAPSWPRPRRKLFGRGVALLAATVL